MSAQAHPTIALRPFLPADAPALADIFRASIAELAADDYSEAQQEAWASAADDEEEFGRRLAGALTLVGTLNGTPVGFASFEGGERIGMLYVHPGAAGQGVATALCGALEKLAEARGAARLNVDAADSATGFFQRRGYVAQQRNSVSRRGEWLANTTMTKELGKKGNA